MTATWVSQGTGSRNVPTSTTQNVTITLGTAPSGSNWIFVTAISNDNAGNVIVGTITCGSVSLTKIDNGSSGSGFVPGLWASPWVTGMSGTITVPFTNTSAGTRGVYAAAVVISGAIGSKPTNWNSFRTTNSTGSFDGNGTGTYGSGGSTSVTSNILSWTGSATVPTTYDSQKEPFVLALWQQHNAPNTPSTTINGVTTISNGNITTTGQATGTLVLNSTTGFASSGNGYINSPDGVIYFSWTGLSGSNLTGCTVSSSSGFFNYSTSLSLWGVYVTSPVLIQTSTATAQPTGGWSMGINGSNVTQIGVNIATAALAGGLGAGTLTLQWGQSTGQTVTPAYLNISPTASGNAGALLYTLVPDTRSITRTPKTSSSSQTASTSKSRVFVRILQATQTRAAKLLNGKGYPRSLSVTQTRAATTSKSRRFVRALKSVQVSAPVVLSSRLYVRAIKSIQSSAINTIAVKIRTRAVTAVQSSTASLSSHKILVRSIAALQSSVAKLVQSNVFRRSAVTSQVVSATVVRTRTYARGIQVQSSYVVGSSRSVTFVRRAVAASSAAVQASRRLGKNYLIVSTATIRQATSGSVRLLIPVVALWNSAKNTTTNLLIRAQALVNHQIFINSNDWAVMDNGQPVPGTGTDAFDDVPPEITEEDDALGTDVVPFHD